MREHRLEEILHSHNSNTDSPAAFKTVVEWLNQAFKDFKIFPAVSFGDTHLSYDELDKLSNQTANYLISQGIVKGDRVGISMQRSVEMIACVIAVLKAGAAYVPLDPSYPVERLEIMGEDARLSLLMTHEMFADRFHPHSNHLVIWQEIESSIYQFSESCPFLLIEEEDIAYVIFTSGSTGRPKGIEMPHRALSNLIEWQLERQHFKHGARVLQYSSISFDVSFQEIATTLSSGGTLFLISDEERRDPRLLLNILNKFKIERLFIPFVALRSMIEVANTTNKLPESLKEIITAGEQLRVDSGLKSFFSKLPDTILENQYGPSETHVISAHLLSGIPQDWPDLPPIGSPIKNTSIYILNEAMEPVEDGEIGELYLAGRNLAHGYIGHDELTRKAFIPSPFDISDRAMLYKTGDLGMYNFDGEIEFCGRVDHQVKIRGYRIEPGEVDTIAAEYPGIAQCITHVVDDHRDNLQLITYYVSQEDSKVQSEEFRAFLEDKLPEYMVPSFFIELDHIPYTPSGKVDFKSLPQPKLKISDSKETISYQSETEIVLADIWSNLLGYENIPPTSNFFDLGGDSLNAVTLFMEIEEQFGRYLPLSVLTQAPTIEELAKVIDGKNNDLDITRFRSLQLIKSGNINKVPLFLVHGGGGNVLMFQELAKGLPSGQPVYAFQWPGWDGYKGPDDVLEMARLYKQELREAWPHGPYRLGGYCIGGVIAIEIAKMLKAEGAEIVDPILVSDAPNLHSKYYHPQYPESLSEKETFKRLCDDLASKVPIESTPEKLDLNDDGEKGNIFANRRFPMLAKHMPFYFLLARGYSVVRDKMQLMRIMVYPNLFLELPVGDRMRYCQTSQITAIKNHKKTVYNGDILYLKSAELDGKRLSVPGWWEDIYFGFEELCTGQFDVHVVGGGHNDVLKRELAHTIIREKMLKDDE